MLTAILEPPLLLWTQFHMYAESPRVGRKKQFTERITLSMPEGTTERIDLLLEPKEARLDFIRQAIERELRRRKRPKVRAPKE